MREGISYTVTLNFAIIFILIVFAFLSATLIYFKGNKAGNIIVNSIEKYEGYNDLSEAEINVSLQTIGYNKKSITCISSNSCSFVKKSNSGYCVYFCDEGDYYYYRVQTNMNIDFPLIEKILPIPIFSNTNRMYDFEGQL